MSKIIKANKTYAENITIGTMISNNGNTLDYSVVQIVKETPKTVTFMIQNVVTKETFEKTYRKSTTIFALIK